MFNLIYRRPGAFTLSGMVRPRESAIDMTAQGNNRRGDRRYRLVSFTNRESGSTFAGVTNAKLRHETFTMHLKPLVERLTRASESASALKKPTWQPRQEIVDLTALCVTSCSQWSIRYDSRECG